MDIQELLKPRYKVIADYPDNLYLVGDVLPRSSEVSDGWYKWFKEDMADKYPNLFKELFWWEYRLPEDMPEYVKDKFERVYKIHILDMTKIVFWLELDSFPRSFGHYYPATQADYESYINQSKMK